MRMDNVGIVVEDIDAAIEFFTELGLTLGLRRLYRLCYIRSPEGIVGPYLYVHKRDA